MKNVLFTFAFLFVLIQVDAQTEKGKLIIISSGGMNYVNTSHQPEYDGDSDKDDEYSQKQFNIEPTIGYCIIDNLLIGLKFGISTYKVKTYGEWSDPDSYTYLGLASQYYFGKGNAKPLVEGFVGYRSESTSNNDEDKFGGPIYGLGAGLSYFINKNFGVIATGRYVGVSLKNKDDNKYKQKGKSFNFQLGFIISLNTGGKMQKPASNSD